MPEKKYPLVSIVLTSHNRSNLLSGAILSACNQTYRNKEIIVVDDASSDNTHRVISSYRSKYRIISCVYHKHRQGLAACRNTGVYASRGNFIAFLDDDDTLKPNSIASRVRLWDVVNRDQQQRAGVIYHGCEVHVVDERRTWNNMPKIRGPIRDYVLGHGPKTIQSTCMFPRTVLEHIGGFDENLKSFIDHDIWMKLAFEGYEAVALDEALTVSYASKRNVSMISDVSSRLSAIETFLEKWSVHLSRSIGKKKTDTWIAAYRSKVLSSLCARKLFSGCATDAFVVFSHILSRSKLHPVGVGYAVFFLGRSILRYTLPGFVVNKFQH